jgi:tRNA threonylcarbamoyladenosine biosynthesis protein TsaB
LTKRFLAIESATKNCSVALFEGSSIIDFIEEGVEYSHAEKLAPFVDRILKKNQTDLHDLSAVGISSGPGSYTGLRIGLSLAKGICVGSKLPLIAVSSLEAMSWGARNELSDRDAWYCPMIDARRMEVYTSLYDAEGKEIESISAKIIDEQSFKEELAERRIYFFGDGASKCSSVIQSANAKFLEDSYISARNMGELLFNKFKQEEFEDLAYFEPNYFKSFKAGKPKKLI